MNPPRRRAPRRVFLSHTAADAARARRVVEAVPLLTHEQRVRIGRRLKMLRIDHGLHQQTLADKLHLSVNTVQGIETARLASRLSNIERIATYFHTTVHALLQAPVPQGVNPLLTDLNDEHLVIARQYMSARKRVREGVELLLHLPDSEQLTPVLQAWQSMPDVREHFAQAIARIVERVAVDPTFLANLLQKIDDLDTLPIPSPKAAAPRRKRPPRKRAAR